MGRICASAPTVARLWPIRRGRPVSTSVARPAARPWPGRNQPTCNERKVNYATRKRNRSQGNGFRHGPGSRLLLGCRCARVCERARSSGRLSSGGRSQRLRRRGLGIWPGWRLGSHGTGRRPGRKQVEQRRSRNAPAGAAGSASHAGGHKRTPGQTRKCCRPGLGSAVSKKTPPAAGRG